MFYISTVAIKQRLSFYFIDLTLKIHLFEKRYLLARIELLSFSNVMLNNALNHICPPLVRLTKDLHR